MINLKVFKSYSLELLSYNKNRSPILLSVIDKEPNEIEIINKEYSYHISSREAADRELSKDELQEILRLNPDNIDLHLAMAPNFEYKIERGVLKNEYNSIIISLITEIYKLNNTFIIYISGKQKELNISKETYTKLMIKINNREIF